MFEDISVFGVATPVEWWVATTVIQIIAIAKTAMELSKTAWRRILKTKQWGCDKVGGMIRRQVAPIVDERVDERVDKRMVEWSDRPNMDRRRASTSWSQSDPRSHSPASTGGRPRRRPKSADWGGIANSRRDELNEELSDFRTRRQEREQDG